MEREVVLVTVLTFMFQVVSTPFSSYEVQSFFALLNLPLPLLKSCVQLISYQQVCITTSC